MFRQGALGLGEAYLDGWWDAEALDVFFHRILDADLDIAFEGKLPFLRDAALNALVNLQRKARAYTVGERHYDIGNDLYRAMLDARMVYSCGYWKDAKDLDAAQEAKLDLICRKLHLEPGMRLLDIGCGWGSLLQYAAEHHDVEGVGITISKEQLRLARERCSGLPVDLRFLDYRRLGDQRFDRVVSVGMFEHVGPKNHRAYMEAAHRALVPDGLHLLHTIGRPRTSYAYDPWVAKYIFPNSVLPSFAQIARATDGLFVVEDLHNIGQHYDPTLMAWHGNFEREWEVIRQSGPGYDERFHRMWTYYLLSAAGSFRAGKHAVWQIVMTKDRNRHGVYKAVR